MTKEEFKAHMLEKYGVIGDNPFEEYDSTLVFRHASNRKWFALLMTISKRKLGLPSDDKIDVVNVKCPQEIIDSMWQENGIFPAYHMNRAHWLSLALDGSVDNHTIEWLVGLSYDLTKPKMPRKKGASCGDK